MHELSLAESAIDLIEDTARRERFHKVCNVRIEIGALSCVDVWAFRFAFESAAAGGIVEGARLEIIEVPGTGECSDCGLHCGMDSLYALCPRCGTRPLRASGGTEMRVRDLDVE